MKILTLNCLAIMILFSSSYGQTSKSSNSDAKNEPFIAFRSDTKHTFDKIDLKTFIGNWKSLDGINALKIYQNGLDFLLSGDYFPGVLKYGDKATLSFSGRLEYVHSDGKLVQINSSQKGVTVGYGVTITIMYENSETHGGGGGGIAISYSSEKDHLIIGTPPYNVFENGHWVGHGSTIANSGIYGKEFKRVNRKIGEIISTEPQSNFSEYNNICGSYSDSEYKLILYPNRSWKSGGILSEKELIRIQNMLKEGKAEGKELTSSEKTELVEAIKNKSDLVSGRGLFEIKEVLRLGKVLNMCADGKYLKAGEKWDQRKDCIAEFGINEAKKQFIMFEGRLFIKQ